ncbi:metalloendopeptidase OMA1, mitochondrial-like [Sipha flava]|jgi:Zn-dependent protease with chaperone function|uniref:Metalloendopeptidase OMA1, mitochondrial n=1 Tax=Sipha flava TaxID=143950 RepID=A0A2S2Q6L3_9HEMI|nr:metalloendopeptidase OMA1, mitochondrial-like [Sipha flava]
MNYFFPYSYLVTCARGMLTGAEILVIPIVKGIGAIAGWTMRQWWSSRNYKEKRRYWNKVKNNFKALVYGITLTACVCTAVILYHVEWEPITGQLILCLYNHRTIAGISKMKWQNKMIVTGRNLKYSDERMENRARLIMKKVLEANAQFTAIWDNDWYLIIEENNELNARSMPFGLIVINSSMMNMLNDDQLAIIIGHEISHTLLRHINRELSMNILVNVFQIVGIVVAWMLLPEVIAYTFSIWFEIKIKSLCFEMPLLRRLEKEADRVGFMMAARACVDITQGPKMWISFAETDERSSIKRSYWWMCTHPSYRSRANHLNQLTAETQKLQKLVNCHDL